MENFTKSASQHLGSCSLLKIGKSFFILLERTRFKFEVAEYEDEAQTL